MTYLIKGREKVYSALRDATQAAKALSRDGTRVEVVRSDGVPIYAARFTRLVWASK